MLIRTLSAILVLHASLGLLAQPQPENVSFESWDNAGQATQEPQQWSSLKTSDGGAFINGLVPQLCWRSTDAHTGQYSVNLRTVGSIVGAANGLLTNGRVHAELDVENSYMYTVQDQEQWRTTLTSRPDSLIGWFKASPETGDRPNVGALLHIDEGRLPAFGTENNYVAGASWKGPYAQVTEWTRFSTPFVYLNDWQPEWLLFILTAGDSAGSVEGTQAWYDDLALIYNVQCQPDAQSVAPGESLNIGYSTGGIPLAPVTFTAELSDASGSFTSPVVMGAVVSTDADGTIACIVPLGIDAGSGYRVRVTGSSLFYAPLECTLEVTTATGVAEPTSDDGFVQVIGDRLWVELRASGQYTCFDSQGALLASGVVGAGREPILTPEYRGMMLVHVLTEGRSFIQRIVMP
jgi:hypothetical protein